MKLIELPIDIDGLGEAVGVDVNPEAVDMVIPDRKDDTRCKLVMGDDEYTVFLPKPKVSKLVEDGMNS